MAGASNLNKIRLTARQQWFEVKDAPSLQTLSAHARLNRKVGVGGIFFNDQNGNYSRRGIYASFAYHLMFSRSEFDLNQLSFGMSAGLIQHSLDQSRFSGNDPLLGNENSSDFYGNIDLGASYYYLNFFAHLTAKNLFSVNRELFYSDAVPSNQRKYLISTGYVIETRSGYWGYEPSVLFQLKEATSEKLMDINFKLYRELTMGSIFGGLSYRRNFDVSEYASSGENLKKDHLQYFTPFAGFEYKRFLFAYTYSQQFNSQVLSSSGFHQLTLGYNFGKNRARYDCYCPGVNQRKNY
jgi:type IX secretion system PorP/SprF family membrane protein